MVGYIIVYKRGGRRVRVGGLLTPHLDYLSQAVNYIDRRLGGSHYVKPKKV